MCHSEAEERRIAPCKDMESGILGFGIWNTALGLQNPTKTGIQNPSFTEEYWNPVPGVGNPQREIQNPRLSRIPLHGARRTESSLAF